MPCAVTYSRARTTGRSTVTSPRSRYAGRWPAGPGWSSVGAPVEIQAALQSAAESRPASTATGSDHAPSPASVSTRTRTSRRSPDANALAGQGTSTWASPSTRVTAPSTSTS